LPFFENDKLYSNRKKKKKLNIEDYDTNDGVKGHLYKIFSLNYVRLQIINILLEGAIGDKWEEYIWEKIYVRNL